MRSSLRQLSRHSHTHPSFYLYRSFASMNPVAMIFEFVLSSVTNGFLMGVGLVSAFIVLKRFVKK